ncbi:FliH/SctL family protein [Roseomonas sp. AR75]|uniref:FliH/SctL family protein n=1 Tax=Roseomonas sp. AR75 TaxID=2562311 RepID=UPI0010BF8806|nr:FliH/SctL family protein [Roseomonas sp. AR75]
MSVDFRVAAFALHLPDLSRPPPVDTPAPPDPALLDAVRTEGEADGHARGFAEGMQEGIRRQAAAQQAAIAASLAQVAAALHDAAAQGRQAAEEAAEALAATLLAAMDAALPGEAARCGAPFIARVAATLLPALADRPEAKIFVAPALADAVAQHLPHGPTVESDASLPDGDARIAWRDGACLVELETRREAVRAALREAGFEIGSEEA